LRTSKPDIVLTDSTEHIEFVEVAAHIGQSDHELVVMQCKGSVTMPTPVRKWVRSYRRADWAGLKSWLAEVDYKSVIREDANASLRRFQDVVSEAINKFIPLKLLHPRRQKPWFDVNTHATLRRKIDAYKQWKSSGEEPDHAAYVEARNIHNQAVRRRKEEFASETVLRIDGFRGRPWWKAVDNVLGRGREAGMPQLKSNDTTYSDASEKAAVLNRLFAAKSSVPNPDQDTGALASVTNARLRSIRFFPKHIRRQLKRLDTSKTPGFDELTGILLKQCASVLCYPLARLFQLSFDTGVFPSDWKVAKVIPVYKKGDKANPANYRPVALLSLLSKLMEGYVAFHLRRHLETNSLLSEHQFGFRKGHSTLHPLLVLHQRGADALDKLQELYVTALDIAGAFDTVWHKRLLLKCESLGLTGKLLHWLSDYLQNRGQKVSVSECLSPMLATTAGVPQGSILGPILFLIYINDLPSIVESIPLVFADDCSLLTAVPRPSARPEKRQNLQRDIDNICNWADQNQLKFAPAKTQLMTISRRKDQSVQLPPIVMSGTELSEVQSVKLLGVQLSNDGSAKDHILTKVTTAGKLVGMLRRQARYLSEKARFHIYVATIRPLLEYSCPVFVNAPAGYLDAMDRIQLRAAKLFPTYSNRLDPLALRRDLAALCQLYRIVDHSAPALVRRLIKFDYLKVQRTTRTSESTNLRALHIPKSRTSFHQRSFLPRTARLWNRLADSTVFADTMAIFKKKACMELRHWRTAE
jgi:hypothetical protein